jgi:membrane protease YdiL (CAAX protease family)
MPTLDARSRLRWLELFLIFGVAPLVLALASRRMVTLGIIGSGVLSLIALLLDPTFPRRQLWDARLARQGLPALAIRTLVVWAGLLIVTLLFFREHLFQMPRTRPMAWLVVMILYPPISAYSQEIMFRTLFFHRYSMLLRTPAARVLASGLLFGWAHIVVHDGAAIALATVGGLMFAATYERRRSTLLVSIEHGLYGDFIFTVGLGGLFYDVQRALTATGH